MEQQLRRNNGTVTERSHLTTSQQAKKNYDEFWERVYGNKKEIKDEPKKEIKDEPKKLKKVIRAGSIVFSDKYVKFLEDNISDITLLSDWQ